MNGAQNIGFLLYFVALGLNALLATALVFRGHARTFPLFTTYIIACQVWSVALFALWYAHRDYAYGWLWLKVRPLSAVLIVLVAAEVLHRSARSKTIARALQFASVAPAFLLTANFTLPLDRGVRFAIAAALLATMFAKRDKRAESVALGAFVFYLFPAIAETSPAFVRGAWLTFVPTISYLAALAIWIRAFAIQSENAGA